MSCQIDVIIKKKYFVIAAKVAKYRQPKKKKHIELCPKPGEKIFILQKFDVESSYFSFFPRYHIRHFMQNRDDFANMVVATFCVCTVWGTSGGGGGGGLHQQSAAASVQGKGFVELGRSLPDST